MIWNALSHTYGDGSWINHQGLIDPVSRQLCCHEHDCLEQIDNIRSEEDGYRVISTNELIERRRVIWRSPGGWWRCQYMSGPLRGQTRCLIGPPQGS